MYTRKMLRKCFKRSDTWIRADNSIARGQSELLVIRVTDNVFGLGVEVNDTWWRKGHQRIVYFPEYIFLCYRHESYKRMAKIDKIRLKHGSHFTKEVLR